MWFPTNLLTNKSVFFVVIYCLCAMAVAEESNKKKESNNRYIPLHAQGNMWIFDYQFSRQMMSGTLKGSDGIATEDALQNQDYKRNPSYVNAVGCTTGSESACLLSHIGSKMTMNVHSFSAQYNQTAGLRWKAKFNYLSNSQTMFQKTSANAQVGTFEVGSSGIGDIQLLMINRVKQTKWFDIDLTIGFSFPLGSIDAKDGQIEEFAPFEMQTGSGTYDVITEVAVAGIYRRYEYGFSVNRVQRTGVNIQNYNQGDILTIDLWGQYTFPFGTQVRTGVEQNVRAPVQGRDVRTSYNPEYTGGKRMDLVFGAAQKYNDFLVYFDYKFPVLQFVNGVQLKTSGTMVMGLQYKFK